MEIARYKQDLDALEGVITKNLAAFYEVGRALMEIRDRRLYKEVKGYKTFEEYCREEWGFNSSRARQLISAAKIMDNVKSVTIVSPTTESQTRSLTKLEPDQQRVVWEEAVETAPEGKVTAAHVSETVDRITAHEEHQTPERYMSTEAMQLAIIAISQLERIQSDDPKRNEALNKVKSWISSQMGGV